jgi:hypothetical protein
MILEQRKPAFGRQNRKMAIEAALAIWPKALHAYAAFSPAWDLLSSHAWQQK